MASQVEVAKSVPGALIPLLVDGFRFQTPACRHYFLTHAHSDHTTGLTRHFDAGLIYCSPVTAALLGQGMGIPRTRLRPLPLDVTAEVAGVEVTPICANHCPGAVMFLFRIPAAAGPVCSAGASGACSTAHSTADSTAAATTVLHTGDLRWHDGMAAHPALAGVRLDVLMLDTTYLAPKWAFPPQGEVVAQMAELMRGEAAAHPATLFVVGSYHIGKERAYLGAAAALGWRVWAPPAKRRVLRLLGLPAAWMALLAEAPEAAQLHVAGMGENLHEQALAERIRGTQWGRVVAIRPTGWSYRRSGALDRRDYGAVSIIGLPYSEHSSFPELRACVRALRPRRLIPTVNAGDAAARRALADCMDLSGDRSRLDAYFTRPLRTLGPAEAAEAAAEPAEPLAQGAAPPHAQEACSDGSPSPGCDATPPAALDTPPLPPEAAPAEEEEGEDAGAAAAEAETVDLTQVDVAQQHRILQLIEAEASGSGAKGQGGGGARTPRQQTSILSFLQRSA